MNTAEHSNRQYRLRRAALWPAGALSTLTLAAGFLAGVGAHAAATTSTWNAGTDSYSNPNAWNPVGVPNNTSFVAEVSNSGTVLYDSTMTYSLESLLLGGPFSSGSFTMSGGALSITNSGANGLHLGNTDNSVGSFTMNGGTLTLVRNASTFFQDFLQIGYRTGSEGTFTLNNGTVTCLGGVELGNGGLGTLNINGGTFIGNGWLGVGRGGVSANSSAIFNQTGGTFYLLRNPGTEGNIVNAVALCQGSTNGAVNISGGSFYSPGIKFANAAGTRWESLNISGGNVYIGPMGVVSNNNGGTHNIAINLSGGTIGSVNLSPNTGGTNLLDSVLTGGVNWAWAKNLAINLTNYPGPGLVTFAPEATRTFTLNAPISGPGTLRVNGAGTVVLAAPEQYTGGTLVSAGTLAIAAGQDRPLGLSLSSGATLALNTGGSLVDSSINLPSGATLAFRANNTQLFTNNVTGAGDVLVSLTGNGAELLTGSLGHGGQTIISSGTLAIGGTIGSATTVLVTNTGTLTGTGQIGAPVTVVSTNGPAAAHLRMGMSPLNVPDTLTINNHLTLGAGSELDIKLGTATTVGGGANDLLVVNGNLTIDPNAFLNIIPLEPLTAGSYVIATYTGTLTGQFTNTVTGLTRYGLAVDYSTPGQIKLTVSGAPASLVWYGMTNNVAVNNWDVRGTPNWLNGGVADTFSEGDAVTFDDTATNCNVVLSTTLYPASITFNNTYSNYSITGTGSGRISGGTGITKNGSGTVLMAAGLGVGNDFTGPVQINGGILKMNGALSLGSTNGSTTVAAGATLDLNGQNPDGEPFIVAGAGLGGTNGAINNTGKQLDFGLGPRRITLTGDTTFNTSSNRWDVGLVTLGAGDGYFRGNGYALTKIGAKDMWLHEVGDTGLGDIFIKEATLGFQYTIGLGNPAKTIFVSTNATLGFWQVASPMSKNVALTNASLYSNGDGPSTTNALNGSITLTGTNTIQVAGAPRILDLMGVISGPGGFQKTGPGPLYLESANTYAGPTLLNAGSIVLRGAGAIRNSPLINLAANTVLDASAVVGGVSLGSGQTLAGVGSVVGDLALGSGATLAPGSALAAATLSLSNSLSLANNSTNIIKLSSDALTTGDGVNDLVLIGSNLVLNGTCYLQIVPLGTLDGSSAYTVMRYSTGPNGNGSLLGSGRLVAFCSNPRYTVSVDTSSWGYVQVRISGSAAPLVWKGDVGGSQTAWDFTTANWLNTSTSQREKFFNGDVATFDDTASSYVANVVGSINAGSIVMSNNTRDYTFTGGTLAAGSLAMEGSRTLTLAMTNAPALASITANNGTLVFNVQGPSLYTNTAPITDNGGGQGTIIQGGTNILILGRDSQTMRATLMVTNGVLRYTSPNNLGDPSAPLQVSRNGSLDMAGVSPGIKDLYIAGPGYEGQGALMDSKGIGSGGGPAYLTLTCDASIGAPGTVRWDFRAPGANTSEIIGNGYKLTKVGTGVVIIYDQYHGDTGLGDIEIAEGRLGFQLNNPGLTVLLGDPNKTLTIGSNATLTFFDVSNGTMSKHLVMKGITTSPTNGMACFDSAANPNPFTNRLEGPVTLMGTNNLFGLRRHLSLPGPISGSGGFVVGRSPVNTGTGTLFLSGDNTYTGPTVISNSYAIVVAAGSSLGSSSLIQIHAAAYLDVSALNALTLGAGQTLMGAGTNIGNVVVGNGATLAPGFPGTSTSALTITGNLTLQAGSTNRVVVNKTSSVANNTVAGLNSVAIGGTLVITNVGNALAGGEAIRLFSAASYSGGFADIIPATPGFNLAWDTSTLLTDGTLRVLRTGPPATPTNLVAAVSANAVTLSWPQDYTGWTLQAQTNAPGQGLSPTWHDVPGSASTNQVVMPIDPTQGAVFYRMILH